MVLSEFLSTSRYTWDHFFWLFDIKATRLVIEKEAAGLSSVMLTESLKVTPLAVLSR